MSAAKLTAALAAVAACLAGTAEAAPSWNVTIPEFASVAMSVTATASKTVIAPIADNGSGAAILRTTDGGKTFNKLPNGNVGGVYLGGSAIGNSAVGASMFSLVYSDEPTAGAYNFTTSKGVLGLTSQSVEAFGDSSYGATGNAVVGKGNGVAVSNDGGATFAFTNVTELTTSARYGAFPSATTWYLSAGQWPENEAQRDGRALTQRLTLRAGEFGTGRLDVERPRHDAVDTPPTAPGPAANSTGWAAQIVKTTDAGKTWTSLFSDTGFYFNQIDCGDEDHCVVVGESDGTGGGVAGVRIYTTADGGATWKRTFYASNPHDSLMAARFSSPTEVWVAGGLLSQAAFEGVFLHSTDAGATWTTVKVPGVYPVGLTFASPTEGYAVAMNPQSVTSFMTFA